LNYRQDLVDFILSADSPVVDVSLVRAEIRLPRVLGDNEAIGRLAAEHLLEREFRHFAWFALFDDPVSAERRHGFASRLAVAGYRPKEFVWKRPFSQSKDTWVARRQWLIKTLRQLPQPLAVFTYNDHVAANVIDACLDAKFRIPEEVAVVGVDNDDLVCECLSVPLSSVHHDLERLGYEGAALLDRLMNGAPAPRQPIRIPPKGVVTRKSSDVIAVEHPEVARALRFIRDRYQGPLSVSDVVAATRLSRRGLEKAFRTHLSRTINEETLRVRLAHARELLVQTEQRIVAITAATGFSRPQYFCTVFRQATGKTPRQYRLDARPGDMLAGQTRPATDGSA
jgi:LacI family transcriptional regulator